MAVIKPPTPWEAARIDEFNMGSHRAVLREAVLRTQGPMIEVGAGRWSTEFLHGFTLPYFRHLVTVEHDPEWTPRRFSKRHHVTSSLEDGVALFPHFGVALIDGPSPERAYAVRLLLPKTEYIVVHDTESLDDYPGLEEMIDAAQYRRDYRVPTTTIISAHREWEDRP